MAGSVDAVDGCCEAWCLSEKRARKRWARGADSDVSVLRSGRIVFWTLSSSGERGAGGEVADGAILMRRNEGWTSPTERTISNCPVRVGNSSGSKVRAWQTSASILALGLINRVRYLRLGT